ncbi:Rha family transcriptional regulator [Comamonas terrigena]|uniref:Rha family transcriptional regulator n=1 Tax=Comamonas terrigena TaxID=32013 RepID=UPI0024490067|nr:Rha family transcriptional regulator [Comamonas terrigena]MDH1700282.1 Rha family transcriptional regulator [Comamonas terrigena]
MADITIGSSVATVSARPELSIHDGAVTTTSIQVAQYFGKRHRDVMRTIRSLTTEMPDDHARNFARMVHVVEIGSGASREEGAYRMTREGFMLLAMGFTGKEALRWKLAYIAAFNRMEAELQKPAHDPQRIQLALRLAAQAAAQVTQTVFDAVMAADATGWQHGRYLLSLGYDREGQATVPVAKAIAHDQMVFSLHSLSEYIASGEAMSSDAQLATLASACTQRLAARAQHREKQMALPGHPGKSATTPNTADTPQRKLN